MIVRLAINRLDDGRRYGKATFYWTGKTSTLNGTASIRLREVDSSTTLTKKLDAPITSSVELYVDPAYRGHMARTPSTTVEKAICLEITSWDLTTDDGYSLNNQSFPLTRCVKNSSETSSDIVVVLDENSKTTDIEAEEEFPFVIGVQNLGPQSATDVIVDLLLPRNLSFVKDQSSKYVCGESSANSGLIRCIASGNVPTGRVGLPIILRATSGGSNNVAVSVETTSVDPNSENNSFTQGVKVSAGETGSCKVVSIPDPNLQVIIREILKISSGPICESDMLLLTSMYARSSSISDLEGLQYAKNLSGLHLSNNQITTILPVVFAELTNLVHLDLDYNQITSIPSEVFSNLTNLKRLDLNYNKISSISASSFFGVEKIGTALSCRKQNP